MAFQQPIQRPSRRAATPPPIATKSQAAKKAEPITESQEWVLFSPAPQRNDKDENNAADALPTATPVTPRSFPRSRLSDFGSLDTAAVSARHQSPSQRDEQEQHPEDDDEADSLDDGLHAFNEPTSVSNPSAHHCLDSSIAEPVLPAHDGLGGFAGRSTPMQQQLWQHEKYNPRRHMKRPSTLRRSSVQKRLDALNEAQQKDTPKDAAEERNIRIEKWRLEQSQAIMEEIEKETRRRRRKSRLSRTSMPPPEMDVSESKENIAPEQAIITFSNEPVPQAESFWARTRRVIQDIIGIDDSTLTYIFGEALPGAEETDTSRPTREPLSTQQMIAHAEQTVPDTVDPTKDISSWQDNLLARIARELGSLVNQLSEHPTSAFSTYPKVQETVPYAGLPTPTEIMTPAGFLSFQPAPATAPIREPHARARHRRRLSTTRTDPSLFGIVEESAVDDLVDEGAPVLQHTQAPTFQAQAEQSRQQREREYWEKDLDINMVLGFLRNRFGRGTSQLLSDTLSPGSELSGNTTRPTFSSTAFSSGPDSLRRAALIRHHHPLVSRNINSLRAASQPHTATSSQLPPMPLSPILGRRNSSVIDDAASSCASQSTKKSKTRHSGSLSLSSSRNYWDIGGPSWGEV